MQNNTADDLRLVSYAIYGEQATTPKVNNLLGKLWQQYNESGKIESIAFDFKGNLLSKQQAVISSTVLKTALDSYQTYLVDWTGLPNILGTQIFETSSEFDALNRATKITLPENVNTDRKEIIPTYNRAGALEKVSYDSTEYVENIAYNAKGQRLLIAFGNSIMTRYVYDNRTFRMLRQRSEKYAKTQTGTIISYTPQSGTNKQDDAFNFDLVGNILKTLIRVNDCGINGTPLGSDALDRNFEYDPMYRVISADGRESDTQHENDYLYADAPVPGSPNANNVRSYTRQYSFDKLGNIQQLKQLGTDGFTRNFTYNTGVNTLQKVDTAAPSLIEAFTYDVCGNQLTAGTTRNYVWNGANQLITYYNQAGSADPTIFAQYDYAGQNRVSKMVRTGTSSSPIYERTIYIDGIFEYHILENGTTYEKNYVHVMDASTGSAPSRVAMVRVGTPFPDDIADAITYNLESQIGSSSVRLNTSGTVIDREEYYPFGDSSLRTFIKKRYRYVGKEKDLESGLYYYGARYYAAWTCRFISVDPLAHDYPFYTPYNYAGNKPINKIDIDGMQEEGKGSDHKSNVNNRSSVSTDTEANNNTPSEKTIHFINSSTGKYLGSTGDINNENYEIRSISSGDFSELKTNNFKPVEILSGVSLTIESSSNQVSIDQVQIEADLQTISQDKKINGKGDVVEQNMYLIFDKTNNKITSYILPYNKNTNRTSENPMDNYSSYYTVEGDRSKVILGQLHTHPDLTEERDLNLSSGSTIKINGTREVNGMGVSEKRDIPLAKEKQISIYAIATYSGMGGNGSIYKVDPNGITFNNNSKLTDLNSVFQRTFDIVRDIVMSNKIVKR